MSNSKSTIEFKYSLLSEEFIKSIGKTRTKKLKDAIEKWTANKTKKSADELTNLYIESLTTYWQKTKLKDFKGKEVAKDTDLVVDLVYKKGRKPNTIRLENEPKLKAELRKIV